MFNFVCLTHNSIRKLNKVHVLNSKYNIGSNQVMKTKTTLIIVFKV